MPVLGTQQAYLQSSLEVETLDLLFRSAGLTMPASVYPVSADTLLYFISRSDLESHLDPKLQGQLGKLKDQLEGAGLKKVSDEVSIKVSPVLDFESYFISEDPASFPLDHWAILYRDRKPFFKGNVDLALGGFAFARFSIETGKRLESYYKKRVEMNPTLSFTSVNLTYPHEAYLSIGNQNLNLLMGRIRSSAGGGVTGNLAYGDNFIFRDLMKLSINTYPLAYDLLINRFDAEAGSNTQHSFLDFKNPSPLLLIHRMSASLWDRLTLTLYEGVLHWTASSGLDPKLLNPMMIIHNLNTFYLGSANNFFGFEIDWAICPTLSAHVEGIFDQIQLKTEIGATAPNANGFLANLRGSLEVSGLLLSWHLEGAYTSPGLYLKEDRPDLGYLHYQTDLIVGNKLWDHSDVSYIGYMYGPNSVAAQAGLQASDYLKGLEAHLLALFKAHGDTGLGQDDLLPTASDIGGHLSPWCKDDAKKPEYLLQFSLGGSKGFKDGALTLYGEIVLQNYWNYKNISSVLSFNSQIMLGARLDPMRLWTL